MPNAFRLTSTELPILMQVAQNPVGEFCAPSKIAVKANRITPRHLWILRPHHRSAKYRGGVLRSYENCHQTNRFTLLPRGIRRNPRANSPSIVQQATTIN